MNTLNSNSIGELMEPEPIGFSFGAPGWTILLMVFIAVLLMYGLWEFYQYKKNKYRRLAIEELSLIDLMQGESGFIVLSIVSLLKRLALTAYGREEVASVYGKQFVSFLQTKVRGKSFSGDSEQIFIKHLYQGDKTIIPLDKLKLFYNESSNWIKQHHV